MLHSYRSDSSRLIEVFATFLAETNEIAMPFANNTPFPDLFPNLFWIITKISFETKTTTKKNRFKWQTNKRNKRARATDQSAQRIHLD